MPIFFRAQHIVLVSLACVLSVESQPVRADSSQGFQLSEPQRTVIEKFLKGALKTWNDVYGNVHYEAVQTDKYSTTGKSTGAVTELKYWSRDNKYFRLETSLIRSNSTGSIAGERRRVVVTPDGFVGLSAASAKSPLAIVEWGTTEDGLDWLLGDYSVLAALRSQRLRLSIIEIGELVGSDVIGDIPSFLVDRGVQRELTGLKLLDGGATLEVKWMRKDGPQMCNSTMLCDVNNGVVISCEGHYSLDSRVISRFAEIREYDFEKYGTVPARCESRYSEDGANDGEKYTRTNVVELRSIDREPVPMGVFSLEAQGLRSIAAESVWNRRILILFTGIALLVGFIAFKRVQKSCQ